MEYCRARGHIPAYVDQPKIKNLFESIGNLSIKNINFYVLVLYEYYHTIVQS